MVNGRHQKMVFSKARGFRRLWRPGSSRHRASRPWRLGFRPQSGLVQRECCIATDVAVLPMAAKTIQPRLRRVGNAPLLPPAAASPPKGEILAVLYFAMLMRPKAGRNYKIHRPKGDTFPSEPFEPSEPSEPGAAELPPFYNYSLILPFI